MANDEYMKASEVEAALEKEYEEVAGDRAGLIRRATDVMKSLWPKSNKTVYKTKYHDGKKGSDWVVMGLMDAVKFLTLSRESASEKGVGGTSRAEDLVFVKDHFELVKLEQKWDVREGRSSKESFRNKELNEEAMLKLLTDKGVLDAFVKKLAELEAGLKSRGP